MFRLLPLTAAAACLTFIVPIATAAEHAAEKDKCIKACNDCLRACRECLIGCDCPECEKTCLTCLETCRACVALMDNIYTTVAYFGHERLWAHVRWVFDERHAIAKSDA